MNRHVVSLELAKQLKEAGWKKETEFWWHWTPKAKENKNWNKLTYGKGNFIGVVSIPAPLATEILEELPHFITILLCHQRRYWVRFRKDYKERKNSIFDDKSLPDALAKMYLYLKKGGLL